jgi:hypothetical protein
MSNMAGKEGNRKVIVMRQILLVPLLFSMSGCLVVGFDPKTEVRTHEELEPAVGTLSDSFSCSVVSTDQPSILITRENGNQIRVDVKVNQTVSQRNAKSFYSEKWEIEDGRAWSIGVIPGNGPVLFTGKIYSTDTNDWDVFSFTFATPIGNVLMLGIPTIASLFGGLGEVDSVASLGLIGACAFDTGNPVGETMVEQRIERSFDNSNVVTQRQAQCVGVTILATVEIPSLWYRGTVAIPPTLNENDNSSYAIFNLPQNAPNGTKGTVRLSFIDESTSSGKNLDPYQGMISHFEL